MIWTFDNLLLCCAQAAILVCCGAMVERVALKNSRLRLAHWQLILAASLALPFVQFSAIRPVVDVVIAGEGTVAITGQSIPLPARMPWRQWVEWCVLGGSMLFFLRLGLGAMRIHLYRKNSTPVESDLPDVTVCLSDEVTAPVTFGARNPVILLPAAFEEMKPEMRAAILAHEYEHVLRKDWLFAAGEEIVRALLWFHPAVWFAIARIHIAREQIVDEEVVRSTGDRSSYVEALLAVAGYQGDAIFVPAPLFLRKRHLAGRVANILKEVSMSRTRMAVSMTISAALMIGAGCGAILLLPVEAAAQENTVQARGATPTMLHKVNPLYPPDAKLKGIQGDVVVEINIDERGLVSDARVLSGPNELRRAALQAVLQWQFVQTGAATRSEMSINFRLLPDATPPAVKGYIRKIEFASVAADIRARVGPRIPLKEGDPIVANTLNTVRQALMEVDPRLAPKITEDNVLVIGYFAGDNVAGRIRVGGNVQSSKVIKRVPPVYPPQAKRERIQGTVTFQAVIDKEGKIANLDLISGHPLLAASATEAVRQWQYQTTHLNGQPVEVITQIDINYTLADTPAAATARQ